MASRGRPRHPETLTPAEQRVCELVRQGKTNGEIAEALGLSLNTVKYHLANSMQKLGVSDRHDLGDAGRWRAPAFRALLSWKVLGAAAGGVSGVLVLAFVLSREDPQEPATPLVAYIALSDSQDWQVFATDPRTLGTRSLSEPFKGRQVEYLQASPDRRQLAFYLRPIVEHDCPPLGSCPAPNNPAEGWVVDVVARSAGPLAWGLEPNSAPIHWSGGRPMFFSVVPAESSPEAAVKLLEVPGCFEWTRAGALEACLRPPPEEANGQQEVERQWEIVITEGGRHVGSVFPEGNPQGVRLSPAGKWVLWNRTDLDGYELRLADIGAGNASQVPWIVRSSDSQNLGLGQVGVWAPDGSGFLFMRGGMGSYPDIWLYSFADGMRQLTEQPGGGWSPAWSPDSTQVAFISVRDHSYGEVYTLDLASSELTRITNNELGEQYVDWIWD